MKIYKTLAVSALALCTQTFMAQGFNRQQQKLDPVVEQIQKEAMQNSQLEGMAFELFDEIGPRLVGSPGMEAANDWTVSKFQKWGIDAKKEQFGQWDGWQRGVTHVDMISPRTYNLMATQLAWSPATKKPVEAEVVVLPNVKSPAEFQAWLKTIKGKFVLMDQYQRWGRPDYQMKEFATPEEYEKIKAQRAQDQKDFHTLLENTGLGGSRSIYFNKELPQALENAGAVGIAVSNWTGIMGADRIFGASTKKIPMINIALEDYGSLYRLAVNGKKPKIRVFADSKKLGKMKSFNTVATIPGKEKPDEYVILSAHLDSWDGSQGATDNGTGTLTMMEAARILKKVYPNNKRTIIVGLWGSEEEGLNGSRAFVSDHPDIIKGTQAAFNQDNGTGRIVNIQGQGFVNSYDYLGRWIAALPQQQRSYIETSFPGMPSGGGSDNASFTAAGVPGISLSSLNWGYFGYTWHTNRDSYDKVMFNEVRNNVIVAATMAYMASEEPELVSREKRVMPAGTNWPTVQEPKRDGN